MKINCPNCGWSYYKILYSASTAAYYPPVYKNGVNVNPDGNITTTMCECANCKEYFSYQRQYGKVISVERVKNND